MLWIAGALTAWATLLILRTLWAPMGGERSAVPSISITLLLLGAGLAGLSPLRDHLLESRLERAAGELAGFEVQVQCQSLGGAALDIRAERGWVRMIDGKMERATRLDRSVCVELRGITNDQNSLNLEQAVALHILTHETVHMMNEINEATTECRAMQASTRVGQALGLDRAVAHAGAQNYWRTQYPRMNSEYRSAECREGGALDQGGPDAPWAGAG